MATKKYWIDKYYNNIQSAGEHNKAFSLEWYLSLPIRDRKIMLEEYKKPSALLYFRNQNLPVDDFIPQCSDDYLCEFLNLEKEEVVDSYSVKKTIEKNEKKLIKLKKLIEPILDLEKEIERLKSIYFNLKQKEYLETENLFWNNKMTVFKNNINKK